MTHSYTQRVMESVEKLRDKNERLQAVLQRIADGRYTEVGACIIAAASALRNADAGTACDRFIERSISTTPCAKCGHYASEHSSDSREANPDLRGGSSAS